MPSARALLAALVLFTTLAPDAVHAQTAPGSLIKLSCPADSTAEHPCRAVYFFGSDGKRHAFPNDKTYFTWYTNFSGVKTVSSSFMASLPLGSNVTYRPGVKMVKFVTDTKVYVVALGGELRGIATETVAAELYGANWNQMIDDISDAFFANYRIGTGVATMGDFNPVSEQSSAISIDDDLPGTRRTLNIATASGTFSVELVKLQRKRYRMITDTADGQVCSNNCGAKSLRDYVMIAGADAAIHGSYFCPPDYPECSSKVNSFLSPFFDTDAEAMINQGSMNVHKGPMLSYMSDGSYAYSHRTKDVTISTNLEAAASNYPSLVEDGVNIVFTEERLEADMQTVKSVRGAIGIDDYFVYLLIARNTTVLDLAEIMKSVGAKNALNLDGGGSAALWFGSYAFGPGRNLPNAILFKQK